MDDVETHTVTVTHAAWDRMLRARTGGGMPPMENAPAARLFRPLLAERLVIGQLGQSLDGRIATLSGHSHYVNGAPSLDHLHRMRALADAVVVGAGTVAADDPRLTVRRVPGRDPARVVIDPRGRMAPDARCLAGDGRRIVVRAVDAPVPHGVEVIRLDPDEAGRLAPRAIVDALAGCGLRHLLIEGGAATLSAFLAAGCLDRLHLLVAPLIIGSGIPGIALPAIETLAGALRPRTDCYLLGKGEVVFDCDLRETRGSE